jgi:hypothetical protein
MRVLKLTFGKNIFLHIVLKFQIFKCEAFGRTYSSSKQEQSCLAVAHPDRISIGLRLASLSLPYTHLYIFIDLSYYVVCFSRGFLPRFWHFLHISFHSMIFIVSSVILLSLCTFRILEYLLGYFLEIVCMKILPYLCVGLIYLCLMSSCIANISLWHPFDSCHNTTFFLGLTGSNISLWCYF